MALITGIKAPNFKLFNSEKQAVALSDFAGMRNVMIHFFPQAFTSVCTEQLCTLRDNLDYYTGLNCEVIGISIDSVFTLAAFKEQQKYQFHLLSDFNKETIKSYDVFLENFAFGMKGVGARAAYIIDKNGTIVYSEQTENPGVLPNFAALKAVVEKLA